MRHRDLLVMCALVLAGCTAADLGGFECTSTDQCAPGHTCCPSAFEGAASTCERRCQVPAQPDAEASDTALTDVIPEAERSEGGPRVEVPAGCSAEAAGHRVGLLSWSEPCEDPVSFADAEAACASIGGSLPKLTDLRGLTSCSGQEPPDCVGDTCVYECGECEPCPSPGAVPSACASYWSRQQAPRRRPGLVCFEGFDFATGHLVGVGASSEHRVLCVLSGG